MSHSRFGVILPLLLFVSPILPQRVPDVHPIPLIIERNQGQAPSDVRYLTHCGDLEAFFTSHGVEFLQSSGNSAKVSWRLVGGMAPVEPVGSQPMPSHSNYFIGGDSSQWVTGIENDGEVTYAGVYPGIDVVFHGSGGNLEHDFRVAPSGDPQRIGFRFEGKTSQSVDANGDLEIGMGSGTMIARKPVAYQDTGSGRSQINAQFALDPDGTVRFAIGPYDRARELVIDPVFGFSTYLAGSDGSLPLAVTSDAKGNIYITGSTMSRNFPLKNPIDKMPPAANFEEIFVSSFGPDGKTLRFSTYLGGGTFSSGSAIAVDGKGNILVAGIATSNFPHAGALPELSCSRHSDNPCYFLASISPSGTTLNYAGKAGGMAGNYGDNYLFPSLTLDSKRNVYLAGLTDDKSFLITPGTLGTSIPGYPQETAVVMKISPEGEVIYSTIIPAKPNVEGQPTFAAAGIVVDQDGRVTIGGTASPGLPTTPGVVDDRFPNSNSDGQATAGFILQLNPTASAIEYATYLRGTDLVGGVTQDKLGNIWLAGTTAETNLPVSPHAFQKAPPDRARECDGGFVIGVGESGKRIVAATYLSGVYTAPVSSCVGGLDGIALDSKGNVYVGGFSDSPDFPVRDPFVDFYDPMVGYAADMILAGLNPSLSSLIFGSYLNPWGNDPLTQAGSTFAALATDSKGDLIVVGNTTAVDFPTTPEAFQSKNPANHGELFEVVSGFVAKLEMGVAAPSACLDTPSLVFFPPPPSGPATLTAHLTNCGDAPLHVKSLVSSSTYITVKSGCSVLNPGASCPIDVTYDSTEEGSGVISIFDDAQVEPQFLPVSSTSSDATASGQPPRK